MYSVRALTRPAILLPILNLNNIFSEYSVFKQTTNRKTSVKISIKPRGVQPHYNRRKFRFLLPLPSAVNKHLI
jgi:hypothetical protein